MIGGLEPAAWLLIAAIVMIPALIEGAFLMARRGDRRRGPPDGDVPGREEA